MPRKPLARHSVTQPLNKSYRIIPLTKGENTIVDIEDFERFSRYNWIAHKSSLSFYAMRNERGKVIYLHKEVLGESCKVDHKNGDTLDNRKVNLRKCTTSQNSMNRIGNGDATSKFKGVWWNSERKKWSAMIQVNGKKYSLGRFKEEEDAARAYDSMARLLHKEFAKTNF